MTPPTSVGAVVHARRTERGFTLQQLADQVGCAKSYLSMIERGRRTSPPSDALLARLEAALELPRSALTDLAHWHNTPAPIKRKVEALDDTRRAAVTQLRELLDRNPPRPHPSAGTGAPRTPGMILDDAWRTGKLQQLVERLGGPALRAGAASLAPAAHPIDIPLINAVAAGYPRDFTDLGYPARTADRFIRSPDIADPDAFACRVVGDSMMPDYREGDIVIFSPARDVKDGMDCFIRLEPDHETTFKRVFFLPSAQPPPPPPAGEDRFTRSVNQEGGAALDTPQVTHLRLHPLNPNYPPRTVPREQVAGLYPAVSVTRKLM